MLKSFSGNAEVLTLSANISDSDMSFSTSSANGWPDGTDGPFVAKLTKTGHEEKILVASRTGNTFTVQQRGYDGTVAANFLAGTEIRHVFDAATIAEANAYAQMGHSGVYLSPRPWADALPDQYPVGFSYVDIPSSGLDLGYPLAYGTLSTVMYNVARGYQQLHDKTGELVFTRSADNAVPSGWTEWKQVQFVDSTAWQALVINSPHSQYNTSTWIPAVRRKSGIVFLEGLVGLGGTGNVTLTNLPVGFRPARDHMRLVIGSDSAVRRMDVRSTGDVVLFGSAVITWTNISCSFPVAE